MSAKVDGVVVRQQLQEDMYTVFTPDILSEAQFQSILTPEERLNQLPPKGFIEPAPLKLPDGLGTYVHIRGTLKL